jgi:NAD(P)H-flavin reductase
VVGVRGPLGNWFLMEQFKGKDIVAGRRIARAPLRPVIQAVLAERVTSAT